jgi:hypothetical protein
MTTYFVNPLTGNDGNNGTSYATAVKSINATALGVASSGDQVRILETPTVDTGLSTTFTRQTPPTTSYTISNATNASPIVITFAGTANFANGDIIFVTAVTGNTAANGMWKINLLTSTTAELIGSVGNGAYVSGGTARLRTGSVFQLPTGSFCKNIFMCGNQYQTTYPYQCTNMTAVNANVTCTINTSQYKYGNVSQTINFGTGFATGKAAYVALGTTVDFSAFQAISFAMLNMTNIAIPDGSYRICLCSDTTGDVIVDSIPINGMNVSVPSGSSTLWYKIYGERTGGGNLGSNIQSVAFYVNTDLGAPLLAIDNIVAVKQKDTTTGINYQSIVGKNPSSAESLYTVGSMIDIVGTNSLIFIETVGILGTNNNSPFYGGTSGTANLFKINPFMLGPTATATWLGTINGNGSPTPSQPLVYSGGWSAASNMTTRTGLSAFSNYNCTGLFIRLVNRINIDFENLITASFATPFYINNSTDICLKNCYFLNGGTNCLFGFITPFLRIGVDRDDVTIYPCYANCSPIPVNISSCVGGHINSFRCTGSSSTCMAFTGSSSMIQNCYIGVTTSGGGFNLSTANYNQIKNTTVVNCIATAMAIATSNNNVFKNCTFTPTNAGNLTFTTCSNNEFYNCTFVPASSSFSLTSNSSNNYFYNTSMNGSFGSGSGIVYFINCPNFSTTIPIMGSAGSGITFVYNNNIATAPGYEILNYLADYNANISISQEQTNYNFSSYKINLRTGATVAGSKFAYNPYTPCLARILLKSGVATNISTYVYRPTSGASAAFAVLGGQVAGIASDMVSPLSTLLNQWEKLTIALPAPSADGVVEVVAYAYGYGSPAAYYDKITWEYV